MFKLETNRLVLRELTLDDAPFILQLLNEPSFLHYIGDKGVRTLDDARNYLQKGPMASYAQFGYGLCMVEMKVSGEPMGICGLVNRDTLPDPDIGFAFFPAYWRQGYAFESSAAVLVHAQQELGIHRVLGITQADNVGSIKTLEKIGLTFEGMISLTEGAPKIQLFALTF